MGGEVLLSTAYFPPAEYFSLIAGTGKVIIEKYENYLKQTYRNRCMILGANGPLALIVPVLRGSFHKTSLSDLKIDNGRKWRELHLRGISSAYASAPFCEYYYDTISRVISRPFTYLLDLNTEALMTVCEALGLNAEIKLSEEFTPAGTHCRDYRYSIAPKSPVVVRGYSHIPYTQVFGDRYGFTERLSILDALLNNGPGTGALLQRSLDTGFL
ncbi:MAG: WbqC family protein [Bacteroidales bacterium]